MADPFLHPVKASRTKGTARTLLVLLALLPLTLLVLLVLLWLLLVLVLLPLQSPLRGSTRRGRPRRMASPPARFACCRCLLTGDPHVPASTELGFLA